MMRVCLFKTTLCQHLETRALGSSNKAQISPYSRDPFGSLDYINGFSVLNIFLSEFISKYHAWTSLKIQYSKNLNNRLVSVHEILRDATLLTLPGLIISDTLFSDLQLNLFSLKLSENLYETNYISMHWKHFRTATRNNKSCCDM